MSMVLLRDRDVRTSIMLVPSHANVELTRGETQSMLKIFCCSVDKRMALLRDLRPNESPLHYG